MQQICDFHLRYIRFICVDNNCVNKLLCDDCQKQTSEHSNHKVIDSVTFLNQAELFLKGGNPEFVLYGSDIATKSKLFVKNTVNLRSEIKMSHLRKLEDMIDKYYHSMMDGLIEAKKMMADFIGQQIEECFSGQILQNRDSSFLITQQVVNALNSRISTKEANALLCKLHSGELEKDFYEKKIIALIDLFYQHTKGILDPLNSQVTKYVNQFYKEMEKIKNSVRDEHFQINKSNMMNKQFKIKDVQVNQNLQLKVQSPTYTSPKINNYQTHSMPTEFGETDVQKIMKIPKTKKLELLRSLDFINHSHRQLSQQNTHKTQQPMTAQFDPHANEFKRIITVPTTHSNLIKILNLHKNICLSAGKDGNINLFSIEIDMNELSIINQKVLKPHQEIRDVELCQTPGMFLTAGRNIKYQNDKIIDLGFTVKLFLFQDLEQIEQLSEFRDLHQQPLELLRFINEGYLRQRVDYSKYSNELEFATSSLEQVKVWKFSFDSTKIYEGEMLEQYKIDLRGFQIRCLDFQDGFCFVSDKNTTFMFQKNELYKQFKLVQGKDQIVKQKPLTAHRMMILSQQCCLNIIDLSKLTQAKYEPLKVNAKKFLRGILFEKEEKEIELIDCIQHKMRYIVMLHSSQYDHFLFLNKSFDLENKLRMPPSEVKWLKLLDMDVNDLMISIDGKNEYSVWDVGK